MNNTTNNFSISPPDLDYNIKTTLPPEQQLSYKVSFSVQGNAYDLHYTVQKGYHLYDSKGAISAQVSFPKTRSTPEQAVFGPTTVAHLIQNVKANVELSGTSITKVDFIQTKSPSKDLFEVKQQSSAVGSAAKSKAASVYEGGSSIPATITHIKAIEKPDVSGIALPIDISKLFSTLHYAEAYALLSESSPDSVQLREIREKIDGWVSSFKGPGTASMTDLCEYVHLVASKSDSYIQRVSHAMFVFIKNAPVTNIDVRAAIAHMTKCIDIKLVQSADILHYLQTSMDQLNAMMTAKDSDNSNDPILYAFIRYCFREILEVVHAKGIVGIDFQNLHSPLYQTLHDLKHSHTNWVIAMEAAIALEDLKRAPSDKTVLTTPTQALSVALQFALKNATGPDASSVKKAVEGFYQLWKQRQKDQHLWYDRFHFLRIFLHGGDSNSFVTYLKQVQSEEKDRNYRGCLTLALLVEMFEIIDTQDNANAKAVCIAELAAFYTKQAGWKEFHFPEQLEASKRPYILHEVRREILKKIHTCLHFSDTSVYTCASRQLETIVAWIKEHGDHHDRALLVSVGISSNFSASTAVRVARRTPSKRVPATSTFLDGGLDNRLENYRDRTLNTADPAFIELTKTYIKPTIQVGDKTVSLLDKVAQSMTSGKKVIIITGDIGSGKTSFMQMLRYRLLKNSSPGNYKFFLLEVGQQAAQRGSGGAVEETLSKDLRLTPSQQEFIKHNLYLITAFDGIDQYLDKSQNIYTLNQLQDLKGCALMIDRSLDIVDISRFLPAGALPSESGDIVETVHIGPQSEEDLEEYLDAYLDPEEGLKTAPYSVNITLAKAGWGTVEKYREVFEQFPQLKKLATNPLCRQILAKHIPEAAESTRAACGSLEDSWFLNTIYDEVIKAIAHRQTGKFSQTGVVRSTDTFEKDARLFGGMFAAAMMLDGKTIVEYSPSEISEEANLWKNYVDSTNVQYRAFFNSLPLKRVGKDGIAWLHEDLQDHFVYRAIYDRILKDNVETLIKAIPVKVPTSTPNPILGIKYFSTMENPNPVLLKLVAGATKKDPGFKAKSEALQKQCKLKAEARRTEFDKQHTALKTDHDDALKKLKLEHDARCKALNEAGGDPKNKKALADQETTYTVKREAAEGKFKEAVATLEVSHSWREYEIMHTNITKVLTCADKGLEAVIEGDKEVHADTKKVTLAIKDETPRAKRVTPRSLAKDFDSVKDFDEEKEGAVPFFGS